MAIFCLLRGRIVFVVLLFVAVAALPAGGQTRATGADLVGTVVDQSRAVLPGATVRARNIATGAERATVTARDGRYTIAALPPGTYSVSAKLTGFATRRVESVVLALGETVRLDLPLEIAGRLETVNIVAQPPSAATVYGTAVSTVISERQIETLPINVRNFMSFSAIAPGVNTDRTPQQGAGATSGLAFAGQNGRSNNITVDGLDNNDNAIGAVRATFSQEAVQEFQVVPNSFSAEFGKASGGIVNVVTKSGSNRLAGNVFGYFRDDALNARDYFEKFLPDGSPTNRPKAPFRQQQFGATLGGPIRRDRAFYFISAERLRIHTNNFVNIDDKNPIVVAGQNQGTLVDVLRRAGADVETGNLPYRVESDEVLARVDASATPKHLLTLRFNWDAGLDENSEPWGGQIARSRGASLASRDFMGAALLTSTFTSHTLNELRLQVAYRDQDFASLDRNCQRVENCGPTIEVDAVSVGRHVTTPQSRQNTRYQVVETLSHERGEHQLKAGIDASTIGNRSSLPMWFGGRYLFQTYPGITAEQALALGLPAAYVQGYGNPALPARTSDIALFGQDVWRVARRVTLSLGVRYQKQYHNDVKENVPAPRDTVLSYGWPADNNNVAPRLAVSWNPFGSENTSLHGSYGVFYSNLIGVLWFAPALINGIDGVRGYVVPYNPYHPNGGSVAAWQADGHRLPEDAMTAPPMFCTIDPALKTPYTHQVSVGLARTVRHALEASAHFVYVRGFNQVGIIDYNPVIPDLGGRPNDVGGVLGTSASIFQYTSWGDSWYRGLTLSLEKRLAHGSGFLVSYTWSKAEDMLTDYSWAQPQDVGRGRNLADPTGLPLGFNPDLERGPALQDQRHRLVVSGVYVLPAGFTVSGIATVGSGRPYNIIAGSDLNRNGDGLTDRPWRNPPDANAIGGDPTSSIGRNEGLLPGSATVDVRLAKRVALHGRSTLELTVEMFNLFNRTNYTEVNPVFGTGAWPDNKAAGFEWPTKAAPPFQVQLGVRVAFR